MPTIRMTRQHVGALGRYHELLALARRLGNIARARARLLREAWSACGLEPARRGALGRHAFHGVLLTPRAEDAVDRGLRPLDSALVMHAGLVLAASSGPPELQLRQIDLPELQVGLWMEVGAASLAAQPGLLDALEQQLAGAGYALRVRETELYTDDATAEETRWTAYAWTRRLSLASLLDEDQPAAAAGRFFAGALRALEALPDEQVEALLHLCGHGDVAERELPR